MFKSLFKDTIFKAAKRGELSAIERYLSEGVPVDAEDGSKWTPLQHAVGKGNLECAEFLIKQGADVNHRDEGGYTALFAVKKEDIDMALLLTKHGADIDAKTSFGFSPLILTIEDGDLVLSNFYISEGADVNVQETVAGGTALLTASRKGFTELVMFLLGNGADVSLSANTGFSPLMAAARGGHEGVVKLLVAYGADGDVTDNGGHTALVHAEIKKHYSIARFLRLGMGEKDKKYYLDRVLEHAPVVLDIINRSIGK